LHNASHILTTVHLVLVFQVVRILDSLTLNDVDLTNGVQPGKSQMFNPANTADIRQFQRMAFGSQDFSSEYTQSKASMNGRRDL
jgi:hypothetical protein